jgi:transposase-like protein
VVERARLFVIDGGKGIRKAIRRVFGTLAVVQRCQIHKLRNVVEHLPEAKRAWARTSLRTAWAAANARDGRRQLKRMASLLEEDHPSAARSVLEGMEETLTLISLGIRGALHRTLRSTNAIENLMGSVKDRTRNVKRWRGGRMALRWTATSLLDAECSFRRIRGCEDLHRLLAALNASVTRKSLDSAVAA